MTATANLTASSLQQLAPSAIAQVKPGDLSTAQFGLLGLGVALVGGAWLTGDSEGSFYFSYLVGYMGVLGICLCGLFFTMLQHITRAGWSVTTRRLAENTMAALPVMLVLFIPVLIGFEPLYHHWLHPHEHDLVLQGKAAWLNQTAFFVRVAVYFVIWIALATFFGKKSKQQDQTGDPALSLSMSRVAAPGLFIFALTITFAAFDWIMSLDPHWFSTIFGVTYFAGAFMSFLAFTILMAKWLGTKGYLKEMITVEHYHDLGKLMFGFMVFWTYTNFSQYMLIWYANLPEETAWFDHRKQGGWSAVGTMLVFGHFFFPFAFLMSRHIKRNGVMLSLGALFLLVIHGIDMQYLILPNRGHGAAHAADHAHTAEHGHGFMSALGEYCHSISWADFGCYFGLLAILAGVVIANVRKNNLVPLRDPRLAESLHFQNF